MNITTSQFIDSLKEDYRNHQKDGQNKGGFDATFAAVLNGSEDENESDLLGDSQLSSQLMMGQMAPLPLVINEIWLDFADSGVEEMPSDILNKMSQEISVTHSISIETLDEVIASQLSKDNKFIECLPNETVKLKEYPEFQMNIKNELFDREKLNFTIEGQGKEFISSSEDENIQLHKELEIRANVLSTLRGVSSQDNQSTIQSEENRTMTEVSELEGITERNTSSNQETLIQTVTDAALKNNKHITDCHPKVQLTSHPSWDNREEIISGLKHQINILNNNETKVLNLKLYPQQLGSISVELKMKNGVLNAHLLIEQIEMKPLLEQAFYEISLDGTGIEQLNVEVNSQNQDQNEFKQQQKLKHNKVKKELSDVREEPVVVQQIKHVGYLNLKV